jgi:hypothetical protein
MPARERRRAKAVDGSPEAACRALFRADGSGATSCAHDRYSSHGFLHSATCSTVPWRTLHAFAEPTVVHFPAPRPFHEGSTVKVFERSHAQLIAGLLSSIKADARLQSQQRSQLDPLCQSVVESRCSSPEGRMAKPENENNIPTLLTV